MLMDRAFHIGGVLMFHETKNERYADPARRGTIVRYDRNKSRWIVNGSCGSQPEIAVQETDMRRESALAASVPDAVEADHC